MNILFYCVFSIIQYNEHKHEQRVVMQWDPLSLDSEWIFKVNFPENKTSYEKFYFTFLTYFLHIELSFFHTK